MLLSAAILSLFLMATPASAQDGGTGNGAPPPENVSALDLYKQGGSFMHILLVCSIGTIAVAVYCFVQISGKKMAPKDLVDRVNAAMAAKDVNAAYSACDSHPSSYGKVMSCLLYTSPSPRDAS